MGDSFHTLTFGESWRFPFRVSCSGVSRQTPFVECAPKKCILAFDCLFPKSQSSRNSGFNHAYSGRGQLVVLETLLVLIF